MTGPFSATDDPAWLVIEYGYDALRERGVESRLAVSNGFLGVRAVPLICEEDFCVAWPRTYVAGLFGTPATVPRILSLVSAPDWVGIRILVGGAALVRLPGDMIAHTRTLDMRQGMLISAWQGETAAGGRLLIRSMRLVSQADRGIGLQIITIESSEDAEISLEASASAADASLEAVQVSRDRSWWRIAETGEGLAIANAAVLRVDGSQGLVPADDAPGWRWGWSAKAGAIGRLVRLISIVRSDEAHGAPLDAAVAARDRAMARGTPSLRRRHRRAWGRRWQGCDVTIDGDPVAQHAIRFALYHLISAGNPDDDTVSIGARALTGEDYRGHVFWDTEIFLLPFYTLTWPAVARALLMYRFHTLGGARAKAVRMGWCGALYAWESVRTGDEATPTETVSADGTAVKIVSGQQEQHISADVAYAVWHYWRATGDDAFLREAGAEIIIETARFWASRAEQEADGRVHIRGVEGPDEYHEGVDDNAYTNVMARWNLQRAIEIIGLFRERWPTDWTALSARLSMADTVLTDWSVIAAGLVTNYAPETDVLEQFDGFFNLDPIDLRQYAGRTVPMDVVLGRERTQRSQVIKQADVVALLALLPELFDDRGRRANFAYYEQRCDHGSSLSRAMHAQVAARLGETDLALRYCREAASIDLADTPGHSAGGVHIATMGGLWQAMIFGFAGLSLEEDAIALAPCLPDSWRGIGFDLQWRGRRIAIRIEQSGGIVRATLLSGEAMTVRAGGNSFHLDVAAPIRVDLEPPMQTC